MAVARVLAKALRALGEAGEAEKANKLAGKAWWALIEANPREADRIDGVMHYLARLPAEPTTREDTAMPDQTIDVRTQPHGQRHTMIFAAYGKLQPGDGFILVNDHDPKPLYYQFDAQHGGEFTWDYLEQGPSVWRVRIGRTAA